MADGDGAQRAAAVARLTSADLQQVLVGLTAKKPWAHAIATAFQEEAVDGDDLSDYMEGPKPLLTYLNEVLGLKMKLAAGVRLHKQIVAAAMAAAAAGGGGGSAHKHHHDAGVIVDHHDGAPAVRTGEGEVLSLIHI